MGAVESGISFQHPTMKTYLEHCWVNTFIYRMVDELNHGMQNVEE